MSTRLRAVLVAILATLAFGLVTARFVSTQTPSLMFLATSSGAVPWSGSTAGVPSVTITGAAPTLTAGTGTQTGSTPLSIFTSTTSASNVSTSETDLITYSLPANTLSSNGQKVRITAWGTLASNANAKTIRLYFGATVLQIYSAGTGNNVGWYTQATVARTGAATQISMGLLTVGASWTNAVAGSPTETLSGAVTIKATGQSATAGGDVTALAMFVEWVP